VDRDGNVVPNAPLPTLFGNSKPPSEATTDADDERAKQRIAAIDAGEKDVGEKLFDFFFGAPVEGEVAGLARTAGTPDTYPATKTEARLRGSNPRTGCSRSRVCERLCYWRRHGWVFGTAVCCASQRGL